MRGVKRKECGAHRYTPTTVSRRTPFCACLKMPALHSQLVPQLSWPESGLFLILLVASLYGFWLRFGKVWRTVRGSKKDPEFRIQTLGRRLGDFTWEVLLQGKV